jgi:hypothetical protein
LVALHLGPLHPVEQALTLVLAFGPFVLLAVTIWITRRRNAAKDLHDEEGSSA